LLDISIDEKKHVFIILINGFGFGVDYIRKNLEHFCLTQLNEKDINDDLLKALRLFKSSKRKK